MTITTIVYEHGEQLVHAVNPGGVDHATTVAFDADQSRIHQDVEVPRQFVWRNFKKVGNCTGLQTLGPSLHKRSERQQPGLLTQGRQFSQRVFQIRHICVLARLQRMYIAAKGALSAPLSCGLWLEWKNPGRANSQLLCQQYNTPTFHSKNELYKQDRGDFHHTRQERYMQLSRISGTKPSPDDFNEVFKIYESSLPAAERKTRAELARLTRRDDYAVMAARLDDQVVGFSINFLPDRSNFTLLEYLATRQDMRGQGIGQVLFEHTLELSLGRPLLVEVESESGSDMERHLQRRRKRYYERLGCRTLESVSYKMPQLNCETPPALDLMYHPNGTDTAITKDVMRAWIIHIYSGVYDRQMGEPAIEAMLQDWPRSQV
jgi:GNAT superfamily N-acetyltransferase